MILINLLPPELRKRSTTYNPLVLVFAGEMLVCLLIFCFCCWIHFSKIKQAEALREAKQGELDTKTQTAAAILAKESQIAELEERQGKLRDLLGRKVYWAHTLDDFANLLSSDFPGFRVRCLGLDITPAAAARGAEAANYSFRARFQVVGDDKTKAGEYIHTMFRTFAGSTFWKQDGFVGKPEDSYQGDRPVFNDRINKVIDSLNLEFKREKAKPKTKAGG
jgi:hypothetical protein